MLRHLYKYLTRPLAKWNPYAIEAGSQSLYVEWNTALLQYNTDANLAPKFFVEEMSCIAHRLSHGRFNLISIEMCLFNNGTC